MTTTEFAALVVNALDEQHYFKRNTPAHPADIAAAFSTVGDTIGSTMEWAIGKGNMDKKEAMMVPTTLQKVTPPPRGGLTQNFILPQDEEISPVSIQSSEPMTPEEYLGYSEHKNKKRKG